MDNQTTKPFKVPTLTKYGSLTEITENHKPKHEGHEHGRAWGHYKEHGQEAESVVLAVS
jgi:hypothetical protein